MPPPMPIIVGSPRSGTTLLRLMLDSHRDLAIPPETGFLVLGKQLCDAGEGRHDALFRAITAYPPDAPAWADFGIPTEMFLSRLEVLQPFSVAEGFRLFYRMYAERFGKRRTGDKTPLYCRHIREIAELLPEAHFIHLVRDGRDAAVSLREQWFSPGHEIETQAHFWRTNVLTARQQGAECPHYLEVRYECLIRETERELRRICSLIDLEFDPAMLRYYERAPERLREHLERRRIDGTLVVSREIRARQQASTTHPPDPARIGVAGRALTEAERDRFEAIAGDALRAFDYDVPSSRAA